jgi:threonine/homoserine/homoserine lactone efflux protein
MFGIEHFIVFLVKFRDYVSDALIFSIIKWLGAGYLVYLEIRMLQTNAKSSIESKHMTKSTYCY